MENLKKELPSGAILEISICSFEYGYDLMKAVLREIEDLKISTGDLNLTDFSLESEMNDEVINTIKNYIARMISSDKIEQCLWKCLERARWNNKKVERSLFEDVEARGDYLIILKEALIYNLSPFFQNLSSLLSDIKIGNSIVQK